MNQDRQPLAEAQHQAHQQNMQRWYSSGDVAILTRLEGNRYIPVRALTLIEAITLPLDPRTQSLFRNPATPRRKHGRTPYRLEALRRIGSRDHHHPRPVGEGY